MVCQGGSSLEGVGCIENTVLVTNNSNELSSTIIAIAVPVGVIRNFKYIQLS